MTTTPLTATMQTMLDWLARQPGGRTTNYRVTRSRFVLQGLEKRGLITVEPNRGYMTWEGRIVTTHYDFALTEEGRRQAHAD